MASSLRHTYVNFSFEVDTAKLDRYKKTDYNHSGGVLYISGSSNYFINVEESKNEKPNGKWRLEYLDFIPRGFFFLSSNVFMNGYSFRRHLHNPKYVMILNVPSIEGTIHKIIFEGSLIS